MLSIDLATARRFILGKQGLWPGRRWHGLEGVQQAMRAMEYLQLVGTRTFGSGVVLLNYQLNNQP